ncbi:hypothetical protein K503DRAFT_804288 [Rhizopogon vinicolor AM-OR11-026]|uniref:Uncharacterized protein n=1 Tax=Rhizopogon vinicolor AM-OR11-026 TaxID=1314800 RepID=A0A1B7MLR3_9AGAM|nr:hypothetical protein K503DRAFT_804288 [Rhizopogon vinicolor AM-OR11-026]
MTYNNLRSFSTSTKSLPPCFRRDTSHPVRNDESRDPLDFQLHLSYVPIALPQHGLLLEYVSTLVIAIIYLHLCGIDAHQRPSSNPLPPLHPPSKPAHATCQIGGPFIQVLRCHLLSMYLTRSDERNAAAGAPKGNNGYRCDEKYDSRPPSPNGNHNSHPSSAVAQPNTGDHGSSWSCFCF